LVQLVSARLPAATNQPAVLPAAWLPNDDQAGPNVPAGTTEQPKGRTANGKPNFALGEPKPGRKSFVDITARSSLGHAPDYSWICGQLEICRHTKTWRLRYLSVDETDVHGGIVTLTGTSSQLAGLQEGQCIKVRGYLWNPDRKDIAPRYRVEAIEQMANAN